MKFIPYALACALGATAVFVAMVFVLGQFRLRRHRGIPKEDFVRAFADRGIPAAIPAVVWDLYKSRVISTEFSVAPEDSYEEVLREGEEDIRDDAGILAKRLGLKVPSYGESAESLAGVKTLRDMVEWLHSASHLEKEPGRGKSE
jgi:hypothetical protein